MKVVGFDGKERQLKVKKRKGSSKLHKQARKIIESLFLDTFYEEVTLPGSKTKKNKTLYADFLCPKLRLMIEVHGEQHYNHVTHYHKNHMDFVRAQNRDQTKIEWAQLNSFTVIELAYNESEDEWEKKLKDWILSWRELKI